MGSGEPLIYEAMGCPTSQRTLTHGLPDSLVLWSLHCSTGELSLGGPGRSRALLHHSAVSAGPCSIAPSVCLAACAPMGWWQTARATASLWRTAPACTTRPATGPARPSGLAAIPGMRGAQSPWGVSGSGYQRPSLETGEPPAQGSRENAGHRLRAGCSQQPQPGRPSGRVSVVLGPPGGRKAAPSQAGTLWVL